MPNQRFEYRLCQVQFNRVTFVNGEWAGTLPPNHEKALETCRWIWDYLNKAGAEGWQMSGALMMSEDNNAQILYLMRALS
ncbi:MAG: hypothetical protein DDG60_16915 [Anaerolineae bacterium]|nr:MAG: hypothetical protein DDG60_16915 [Anaerolineae bacterium]